MRQRKEMDTKFVIWAAISALLVLTIYSSSITLEVSGATKGVIICSSTNDPSKVLCCQSEFDDKGNVVATWCTTCDHTNPPSNCTPREKATTEPNPGRQLSTVLGGGVLEEPKTQPKLGEDIFPKGGGVLEQEENNNTFTKSNVPFPQANDSDDE